MLSHLLLDVDGVIVGSKPGHNSPTPNEKVCNALREVRERGVTVSFCTGKPLFSLRKVIDRVGVGGVHISDGGAQVYDANMHKLIASHTMAESLLLRLLEAYHRIKAHLEFYTPERYTIRWQDVSTASDQHWKALDFGPQVIDNAADFIRAEPIVKLVVVASDASEKPAIEKIYQPFAEEAHLYWGIHPSILPLEFAVLTNIEVSKKNAAVELEKSFSGSFESTLGAGDGTDDWEFMQLCKYKVALGNATDELKQLVAADRNGFITPDVDEDGMIDALRHFKLVS